MRWRDELAAALGAAAPHAFAYRRSAATLFDLDGFGRGERGFRDQPEVAVAYPQDSRTGVPRLKNISPHDVVELEGVPATCVERTLLDLGNLGDADLLEAAIECAIRRGWTTDAALRAMCRWQRYRGLPTLRTVMARRPVGAPPTDSYLETLTLQLCRNGGLPVPDRQVPPHPGSRQRVDLAWPEWKVAIECDGRATHERERFDDDRSRQNGLVLVGWLVLRFTWQHVTESPDRCIAQVRKALRDRGCPV